MCIYIHVISYTVPQFGDLSLEPSVGTYATPPLGTPTLLMTQRKREHLGKTKGKGVPRVPRGHVCHRTALAPRWFTRPALLLELCTL